MKHVTCPDCGSNYAANVLSCPTCGCPNDNYSAAAENGVENNHAEPTNNNGPVYVQKEKSDWANYIYECALLMWHTFSRRFASFSGRATRREYWSFAIMTSVCASFLWVFSFLFLLLCIIPYIAVTARRMHDINKSGWWMLCPVAGFFLLLKKSDNGINDYGKPSVDDI